MPEQTVDLFAHLPEVKDFLSELEKVKNGAQPSTEHFKEMFEKHPILLK